MDTPKQLPEYIIHARNEEDLESLLKEFEAWNVKTVHRYRHVFCGAAVRISNLLVKWYKDDSRILKMEKNEDVVLFDRQTNGSGNLQINHLDRIDQRNLPLSSTFTYSQNGQGVVCYVLDSGGTFRGKNKNGQDVGFEHVEFEGRLTPVPDPSNPTQAFDPFFDALPDTMTLNSPRGYDAYGHGTHVAGIIGSKTYGVAKKVSLRTAKVFSTSGNTTNGIIIAGIDAIIADHNSLGNPLAVCNMSFGGRVGLGSSPTSLEIAVQAMIDQNIFCCAAAGNRGEDASTTSPARMSTVMTVGASQAVDDKIAAFSNFGDSSDIIAPGGEFGLGNSSLTNTGSVVDIFAPGVGIISTYNTSSTAVLTLSGTSMSSPMVAGVAALHIQSNPSSTPAQIFTDIRNTSTPGVLDLSGALPGTPNLLLYSNFVDQTIEWSTPAGLLVSVNEGLSINFQLRALGFSGRTVIYQVVSGSLPPGILLDANSGFLQGITQPVTVNTTYTFTVRAYDGSTASSTFTDRQFRIDVLDAQLPPIWNTFENLGSFEEGSNIGLQLAASSRNGVPAGSLIYTAISALPPGLSLSSLGFLSGTAPQTINNDAVYMFEIKVDDGQAFAIRQFTLTIRERNDTPVDPNLDPDWRTPSGKLGEVIAGNSFNFQLVAIDPDSGPLPLEFFLARMIDGSQIGPFGELPPGLTLNESTGVISGTVLAIPSDREYVFAVYVTDGASFVARLFSIRVFASAPNQPPVWITASGSLGTFDPTMSVNIMVEATDPDSSPNPVTYSISNGTLPPGLLLNSATGQIYGTPLPVVSDQVFSFIISASDGLDYSDRSFYILIMRVNTRPVWISNNDMTISAPGQTVRTGIIRVNEGGIVSYVFEASDFLGDILTYTIVGGSLPPNVSLNANGLLTGGVASVNADTEYEFTVRVDDSLSNPPMEALFADRTFRIEVVDGLLNPNRPPEWITPAGILEGDIDPETDRNSGYAYEGLPYRYQLEAINPEDSLMAQSTVRYTVVGGNLPNGLALNFNSGVISGTPLFDDNYDDEDYPITVRASDGVLFTDRNFIIKFIDTGDPNQPPIWVTPNDIGTYNESEYISIQLEATDPEGTQVIYALAAGSSLPIGLSITTNGFLIGEPSNLSSTTVFQFVVRAIDQDGGESQKEFQLTILKLPNESPNWITPADLGTFEEGDFFNVTLVAQDPDFQPLPVTYTVVNDDLPPGLSLDSITGELTGVLPFVGSTTTYSFEISATDGISTTIRTFFMEVTNVIEFMGDYIELSIPVLGNLRNEYRKWNNFTLISDSNLFLPDDPRFGRVLEPKVYVADRIRNTANEILFQGLDEHHRRFDTIIGSLKSATARDSNGNAVYDVIYLEVIDPQKGSDFDILNSPDISNLDTNGSDNYVSHSLYHIRQNILDTFENDETLPLWMISEQIVDDPDSILGYTPSIEVAYVIPGRGQQLVNNLIGINLVNTTLPSMETEFDLDLTDGLPDTIFDNDTTTFDETEVTRTTVEKGVGLRLTGQILTVDRYLYENTDGTIFYMPWPQLQAFPHWITQPGLLGTYTNGDSVNINLETSVQEPGIANYSITFGSLPTGLIIDPLVGIISGTVNYGFPDPNEDMKIFHFVVKVWTTLDKWSECTFEIIVNKT